MRLLAQIISGSVHTGVLTADEFLYYAQLLEPLRSDELMFLGTLQKQWSRPDLPLADLGGNDAFRRASSAMTKAQNDLVPAVFQSARDMQSVAAALMRTGLLIQHPTMGAGVNYEPSPLFERLLGMVDIEAALPFR